LQLLRANDVPCLPLGEQEMPVRATSRPPIQSAYFAAASRAVQQTCLLWFFGNVFDPLETFWRCIADIQASPPARASSPWAWRKSIGVCEAIEHFHDEALSFYVRFKEQPRMWIIRSRITEARLSEGKMFFFQRHGRPCLHLLRQQSRGAADNRDG
jgi:hypothetical protein